MEIKFRRPCIIAPTWWECGNRKCKFVCANSETFCPMCIHGLAEKIYQEGLELSNTNTHFRLFILNEETATNKDVVRRYDYYMI